MNRRTLCRSIVAALFSLPAPAFAVSTQATLFKKPICKCCDEYVSYLREYGFEVQVKITNELAEISRKAGVPEKLEGCHTMFVDGYVVEGLVPVRVIRRLLSERPAIAGITLPGLPAGSPEMPGEKKGPFTIYAVTRDGAPPSTYAVE
ncbi:MULTISPECIES: DUF411 domain-containing protein [unclassified Bradyrhizobium]|uniref:DUF411 domain-containing protein n=1 Tax=unclassified Bradyrhizobium TaxID=2631580 RepID=UPI001BA5A543|nr:MULTISPECIES: DUF411 domain-containing protein [unclassified Bradyrhizobium]MBR1208134.1 CopG family transcriptional regulator [Bradyrhizobium sp. AUGA SZCCT0124]MBR1316457.1 CopG family transcriptional regulator [Bradyrhizobium sp. AUGA SZCCT0051]MBR1344648.1 CopG family transcriptional regulator [Bradyrhizobium sp. AUGA SZCCT0105]MBR1359478.1 CopG family transcriptional regulator [Bradyrhizobium sp. AUGA SZCCT0045]